MKRFLPYLAFSFILVGLVSAYLYFLTTSPSNDSKKYDFVVNQGDGLSVIAAQLENNGYIRNRYSFMATVYYLKLNKKIQAGSFKVSKSSNTFELAKILTQGGSHDYWFQVKDGQRVEEIVQNISELAQYSSKELELKMKGKEGLIYPDKYLFPQEYTSDQVVEKILSNFESKYSKASAGSESKLSKEKLVTLASILEREGRSPASKKMIAGVLYNRLEAGMPLQVDATVQYARDSRLPHPKEYWEPVTSDDLKINSQFNTYINQSLPPSPICNPGYDSLYAASHPEKSDFFFYITGNDGKMYYAKTLEEHNKNVRLYLKN